MVGTCVYGLFILAGITFYIVLKGAAGHGFIFYWYETLSFIILVLSPISIVLLTIIESDNGRMVMKVLSTILSSLVLLLAIVVTVFTFGFNYGNDVYPLIHYILVVGFLGLSSYEFYVVISDKLIGDEIK